MTILQWSQNKEKCRAHGDKLHEARRMRRLMHEAMFKPVEFACGMNVCA